MSVKKYKVELSQKQRKKLKGLSKQGKVAARTLNRARVLLLADENRPSCPMTDEEIREILDVSNSTIGRTRQRFVRSGLDGALYDAPRPGRPSKFDGSQRAKITALACSTPPDGNGQWSMRLLAERLVELDFVEGISHTSVANILKKTNFPRI